MLTGIVASSSAEKVGAVSFSFFSWNKFYDPEVLSYFFFKAGGMEEPLREDVFFTDN